MVHFPLPCLITGGCWDVEAGNQRKLWKYSWTLYSCLGLLHTLCCSQGHVVKQIWFKKTDADLFEKQNLACGVQSVRTHLDRSSYWGTTRHNYLLDIPCSDESSLDKPKLFMLGIYFVHPAGYRASPDHQITNRFRCVFSETWLDGLIQVVSLCWHHHSAIRKAHWTSVFPADDSFRRRIC